MTTYRRRRVRLFRYSTQRGAARTLKVLRARWPETGFSLVPESLGFGWVILATKPDGASGLVQRRPLWLIARGEG